MPALYESQLRNVIHQGCHSIWIIFRVSTKLPAQNVSLSSSTQSQVQLRNRRSLSHKFNVLSIEETLREHGYRKLQRISKTLQGELILAETINNSSLNKRRRKVAIKRSSKQLLKNKTCIEDNDATHILSDENIITEAILLNDVTVNNTPPGDYVTKFIEFF